MNDAGFLWELFEETGSIALYLAYRRKTSAESADAMPISDEMRDMRCPAE